ncbi:MAG: RNA repair domain-containing protein [archaeon]
MKIREQDRHFLWSLLAAVGVIFVWKGLWEGLYEIPYLGDPWVALFVGLAMLTFSGIIFKEFDPLGSLEKSINKKIRLVHTHPKRHEYQIRYYDKIKKKKVVIKVGEIKRIERGSLILKDAKGKQEIFIPTHRITEVLHKGKTYWKI